MDPSIDDDNLDIEIQELIDILAQEDLPLEELENLLKFIENTLTLDDYHSGGPD